MSSVSVFQCNVTVLRRDVYCLNIQLKLVIRECFTREHILSTESLRRTQLLPRAHGSASSPVTLRLFFAWFVTGAAGSMASKEPGVSSAFYSVLFIGCVTFLCLV